jgi:uncharacterized protein (DUF58 family)
VRVAACAIALLLVVAGLLRAEGAFFASALPFAAFAALGVFWGPPALSLEAVRQVSASLAPAGARVEISVTVTNRGGRIEALTLEDVPPKGLTVMDGRASWQGTLDPGAVACIHYGVEGARGAFAFESLEAQAEDPFTAMKTRVSLPCSSLLAVHPRPNQAPKAAFGAGAARPFSGRSRAKRAGTGTDFAGTREYMPGDPLKCLNWRAEALWGRPIVNVFEEERAIDVGIILDCRHEAYDRMELFEAAVGAALTMGEDLLDHGHRVAFLSYGSLIAWTPSGAGRDQRLRLRMAAARAALGAHAAFDRFDNLPVKIFPPRSLVLLVSPLRREDLAPLRNLRALHYQVAVLRPDPLSLEALEPSRLEQSLANRLLTLEADALQSRLLRAGITILPWHVARPLSRLRVLGGSRA